MPDVDIKIVIDNAVLNNLLRGVGGPVYTDMLRRADKVQRAAKEQIPLGPGPSGPRGHLRESVVKRIYPGDSKEFLMDVWVGSDHPRALMHHEGTAPHLIEPVRAEVLAFNYEGEMVFTAYVFHPGTSPNKYLTDNLPLAVE